MLVSLKSTFIIDPLPTGVVTECMHPVLNKYTIELKDKIEDRIFNTNKRFLDTLKIMDMYQGNEA